MKCSKKSSGCFKTKSLILGFCFKSRLPDIPNLMRRPAPVTAETGLGVQFFQRFVKVAISFPRFVMTPRM